jgi:hypothetical protein
MPGKEPVCPIKAFFDAAPPRFKGFCFAKTLFRSPRSFDPGPDSRAGFFRAYPIMPID